MLLNVICFGLLFSGALSDAIPENATYVLAENLAFPEGFSQSPGLLQPADELQKRQGFRCPLPGWTQCPNIPMMCKPAAASCCPPLYYYFPASEICCQGRGACPLGWNCCPNSCCPQGGMCGGDGLCSTLTFGTQTQTRTQSQPRTSTGTGTRTSAQTSRGTATRTSTSSAYSTGACSTSTPSRRDVELEERQRYPWERFCTRICHVATRQEMVVMNLKNIPGQTNQLVDSTCRGMRARRDAGQLAKGLNEWEDILTYNGKKNRVTTVDCDGFCIEANRAVGRNSFQCDEYPPGVFNQQANVQTRLCIDRHQNSGTQGPILSDLVKACNLKRGDKVLFRVDGGCPDVPVIKRDEGATIAMPEQPAARVLQPRQETTTISLSDNNATLRNPNGDDSLTYVAIDLGVLQDGHYDLEINLDGSVTNVTVLDSDGDDYASIDSPPTGTVRLSFDVAVQGAYLPFALIAYTERATNISMTGTATVTPTATPSDAAAAQAWSSLLMMTFVAGMMAVFL